jgi:protein involved in polysaccharide export with SLBB domain
MFKRAFFVNCAGIFVTLLIISAITAPSDGQAQTWKTPGFSGLPADLPPQIQQLIKSTPGITDDQVNQLLQQAAPKISNSTPPTQIEPALPENLNKAETSPNEVTTPSTSNIEKLYQQQYNSIAAENIEQYGYSLFRNSTTSISKLAVPSNDYLLGPGDKLRIRIWGSDLDADYVTAINRDGTINVPRVGIIPVTGIPFGQIDNVLRREAEKYVQGINVNVSLEELRTIEIYVIGEVENPGLHLVPAFSTVLNALTASSIMKSGSLRAIKLLRSDSKRFTIDLYSLLLKGSRENDFILQNGDVIFVPRLKKTAAIAGGAVQPAIYELLGEKSVADLLELAGGPLPQTFTGKMILRRFTDNNEFVIKDIDLRSGKVDLAKVTVENGDLLELQMVKTSWPQAITIKGNVWKPDFFSYRPGLKLSDVLTGPDLLKPESILDFALLHHYNPKSTRYEVERFPLSLLFEGKYDKDLLPFDRIEILSREAFNISEPIQIHGAVWKADEYTFTPGLTLSDLIGLAGGLKFDADVMRIDLSRQIIHDGTATTEHNSLSIPTDENFGLQPYDYIFVRQIKDATSFKSVSITGEVKYPGQYRIKDGEKLSSVIERAGGFSEKAYFYGAVFTSEQAKFIQQQGLDKMIDDLEVKTQSVLADQAQLVSTAEDVQAAQVTLTGLVARLRQVKAAGRINITLAPLSSFKDSTFDFEVRAGDSLHIPNSTNFVSVLGSVYSANSFLYNPNDTLVDYLNRAGGPTSTADADSIYIVKANGNVISARQANGLFHSFDNTKMMPGDSIIVPEDLDRIPYLRLIHDLSDIVFKIATTVGIAFAI